MYYMGQPVYNKKETRKSLKLCYSFDTHNNLLIYYF